VQYRLDELLHLGSQGIFFAFRGRGRRESAVKLLLRRSADVVEEIGQVGGGLKLDFAVVRVVHHGRDIGILQSRPSDLENRPTADVYR
jgi:hypothetical protein